MLKHLSFFISDRDSHNSFLPFYCYLFFLQIRLSSVAIGTSCAAITNTKLSTLDMEFHAIYYALCNLCTCTVINRLCCSPCNIHSLSAFFSAYTFIINQPNRFIFFYGKRNAFSFPLHSHRFELQIFRFFTDSFTYRWSSHISFLTLT